MKQKGLVGFAGSLAMMIGLTGWLSGCEWSGGGGATTFNSRYSFVNFSGTYRGISGGLLVTDYTKTGANSTNLISNETLATGNGVKTSFSGTTSVKPIIPGSITITAPPSYTFVDDGNGNLDAVTPSGSSAFGVINYASGVWSLDFQGVAIDSGAKIKATYQSVYSSTAGGKSSSSGSTGSAINTFQVEQQGNLLRIIDNNGAIYSGKFGDIRSTGGVGANSPTGSVTAGEVFIGDFSATGTSAAGVKVKMVGTFNGGIEEVSGSNARLGARTITGSWIENTGKIGDISGYAEDLMILVEGNDNP